MKRKLLSVAIACLITLCPLAHAENTKRQSTCPDHPHQRTNAEVLQSHLVALLNQDAQLISCDYAKDAIYLFNGMVARGPSDIAAQYAALFALAGGNISVSLNSSTSADDITLVEYSVDSNHLAVGDGADTFEFKNGLITVQTVHAGGLVLK